MGAMGEVEPRIDGRVRERLLERYRAIDGPTCRRLTEAALAWLRTNQQIVNSLNVFPVPDGDTGTNMVLTMQAAWDEIASHSEPAIGRLAKSIAHGALMGARGNSGVILSQLWRGFARALDDAAQMDVPSFVRGLAEARDTAYKGVVRPVEGTILTVAKDIASAAEQAQKEGASSALEILERIVQAADESVQRTPDLLPVLKQAGVVDSGGMGLYLLLEGMLRSAYRQPLDTPSVAVRTLGELTLEQASESIEPGQDWEVVVDFRPISHRCRRRFPPKHRPCGFRPSRRQQGGHPPGRPLAGREVRGRQGRRRPGLREAGQRVAERRRDQGPARAAGTSATGTDGPAGPPLLRP